MFSSVNKPVRLRDTPDLSAVRRPLGLSKCLDPVGRHLRRSIHIAGEAHVAGSGVLLDEALDGVLFEVEPTGLFRAENVTQLKGEHRIVCSALPGPSRHQRRHQSSHLSPPRSLGVIEGERLQRSRGYHEDYSLAKALAALIAIAAILFCGAVVFGAI